MPTIITAGVASAKGFGFAGGGQVLAPSTAILFAQQNASLGGNNTYSVPVLAGYSAGIYIYFVGDATAGGSSCCGNCGRSAAGEFAQFAYTCTGTETSFTLQFNLSGTNVANNIARLTVNGGTNNGKFCQVGSYNNNCGYGNAAAPTTRSSGSDASFSRVTYGAYAPGYGNYYSDGYYYSACGSSYGSGQNGYSADGHSNGASGGCSNGQTGALWIQYRNNY